ncbi:hypothetical protein JCM10213_002455 [Rhodosporidiobolus nylandii]
MADPEKDAQAVADKGKERAVDQDEDLGDENPHDDAYAHDYHLGGEQPWYGGGLLVGLGHPPAPPKLPSRIFAFEQDLFSECDRDLVLFLTATAFVDFVTAPTRLSPFRILADEPDSLVLGCPHEACPFRIYASAAYGAVQVDIAASLVLHEHYEREEEPRSSKKPARYQMDGKAPVAHEAESPAAAPAALEKEDEVPARAAANEPAAGQGEPAQRQVDPPGEKDDPPNEPDERHVEPVVEGLDEPAPDLPVAGGAPKDPPSGAGAGEAAAAEHGQVAHPDATSAEAGAVKQKEAERDGMEQIEGEKRIEPEDVKPVRSRTPSPASGVKEEEEDEARLSQVHEGSPRLKREPGTSPMPDPHEPKKRRLEPAGTAESDVGLADAALSPRASRYEALEQRLASLEEQLSVKREGTAGAEVAQLPSPAAASAAGEGRDFVGGPAKPQRGAFPVQRPVAPSPFQHYSPAPSASPSPALPRSSSHSSLTPALAPSSAFVSFLSSLPPTVVRFEDFTPALLRAGLTSEAELREYAELLGEDGFSGAVGEGADLAGSDFPPVKRRLLFRALRQAR